MPEPSPTATTVSPSPTRAAGIYARLKERLLSHHFRMGDLLREEEVASWFGASRLPARDAMRQLEQEGLIERDGRRYRVRYYGYGAVEVIYRMRAALEHAACDNAVARGTPEDFATLERNLDAQQHLVEGRADRAQFSELDAEFHLAIARIGGNPVLTEELGKLLDRVRLIRSDEIARDNGPAEALAEHRRILQALKRGDAATAKAEIDYHYSKTLQLHHVATGSGGCEPR